MSNVPLFVISLDFELYWGMFDKLTLDAYGKNIEGVHHVVPEILALFTQYNIHATWATVGMLMSENKTELLSLLPSGPLRPAYADERASSYAHIETGTVGETQESDPYHYGARLVRQILNTPNQELGSHTFSHYYAQDGSKNGKAIFAADCEAFKKASAKFGTKVTSFVFPRNQTTNEALSVIQEAGFTTYRGTPSHFLYHSRSENAQTNPVLRLLRLLDAYINISGHHTFTVRPNTLTNVPASRFLRPYSPRLQALEHLRLQRIKKSMTYAAQHGEVFHLWWHPHNFGTNRKENLSVLIEILQHFKMLEARYGMKSASMKEAATRAIE